jgi:hypothetical protein
MLLSLERKATNSSLIPREEHEAEKSGQLDGADHGQDGCKQQTHDVLCALQIVLESYCIVFVRVIDGRKTMASAGKPGVVVVGITSRLSRLTWSCETQIRSRV